MKNHSTYCMITDTNKGLPKLNKAIRACHNHNKIMDNLPTFNATGQIRYEVYIDVGPTKVIGDDNGIIEWYATRICLTFRVDDLDAAQKRNPNDTDKEMQRENHINNQ